MKLKQKLALCWRILRQEPGGLMAHAERELPKADEPMQALMNQGIKELILVFGTHGHSGFSASYAVATLEKLLRYEPLGPLTGEPSEWMEVQGAPNPQYQNNRCGTVFKDADGRAYNIDGKVWREPSGACYTNLASRVFVEFPYVPKTEYVDVPEPQPS